MDLRSLEIRMSRSENLPVLPQAVSTIIQLADDPNSSQRELEKAFERDPAITAKILRVANSPYYGGSNAASIGRAISFLGITAIRSLVVGVAFQQVIGGKGQSQLFHKLEYWKHSLATAVSCRILGKMKCPAKAEELYCAGMMHDIGLLVLDRFMPGELDECLGMSRAFGMPLHVVEQEKIGFDHAQVGGMLSERWNLSPLIQAGIRYHHDFSSDTEHSDHTVLVTAGNALAHAAGFNQNMPEGVAPLEPELLARVGIPVDQLEVIMDVVKQEIQRAQDSFRIAA